MTAKQDAPLLSDLLPWSVPPLRPGRAWVTDPDPAALRRRWDALVATDDPAERARLLRPSRARTLHTAVGQLPGQATATGALADAAGRCPEPVRYAHGGHDLRWLLPDHRLLDAARPELWRVADDRQLFVVEWAAPPRGSDPPLLCTAALPDGRAPSGRGGRIRPLHRRPGGHEPNLAPGLTALLTERLGRPVAAADVLAWAMAAARPAAGGCAVPLPADAGLWERGVALGERLVWLQTRGAHDRGGPAGARPRMPGGRRPYVRAPLPIRGLPADCAYDADEEALLLGAGRIAPVPAGAWAYHADGVRVLEAWCAARSATAGADGAEPLAALGTDGWPPEWTTELLELVTVLALLAEAEPERAALREEAAGAPGIGVAELRAAGVLPVPARARRPASVLDHQEEGPGGQFALL
ncbi:type ISP restriction/modification enzyme [Streptomyces catenulae]|uniref:Type ISP restriction/modification enzyme n=1 Tax=Streptomyces catenulae TaxID=66875 RepID=A0ABV2Z0B2_9ACTN|nr:type ISP restriction/modification enzyme [Streptomyces catenulae]